MENKYQERHFKTFNETFHLSAKSSNWSRGPAFTAATILIKGSKDTLVLEGHRSAWHERVQTLVVGGVSIRNRSVISN